MFESPIIKHFQIRVFYNRVFKQTNRFSNRNQVFYNRVHRAPRIEFESTHTEFSNRAPDMSYLFYFEMLFF